MSYCATPRGCYSGKVLSAVWIPIFTYDPTETVMTIVDVLLEMAKTTGYVPTDTCLDVLAARSLRQTVLGQQKVQKARDGNLTSLIAADSSFWDTHHQPAGTLEGR